MAVEIEFDTEKDAVNRAKHGLPLDLAALLFAGAYQEKIDDRQDYGEARMIAFGMIMGRLCACAYTWRNNRRRIISLRKANSREYDAYCQKQRPTGGKKA
jgi:uncharacterized DUF497 family protein